MFVATQATVELGIEARAHSIPSPSSRSETSRRTISPLPRAAPLGASSIVVNVFVAVVIPIGRFGAPALGAFIPLV